MLHGRPGIPLAFLIFAVLEHDGLATLNWPYRQRRELLDDLDLHGSHWDTTMSFEDGERLFRSVREIGLEGVVAKKLSQRYRPGERLWVKVKNRDYWRFPLEREAAGSRWTPSMSAMRAGPCTASMAFVSAPGPVLVWASATQPRSAVRSRTRGKNAPKPSREQRPLLGTQEVTRDEEMQSARRRRSRG